jgi:hypothetical protein
MDDPFFGEKFDDFRVEVIDRLARIETQHTRILERLDRINGTMEEHGQVLVDHEARLARIRGAAGILAALVAAAVSAVVNRLRVGIAP